MRTQTFFHRQTHRRETTRLLAALGLMLLFFSGCAALEGGASQMQSENEEQTSSAEATMNGEPATAREGEGNGGSERGSQSVQAGDAVVTVGDGSVVVRAGDAEVTTGGGSAVASAGGVAAESGAAYGNGANVESAADTGTAELRLAGDDGTSFSGDCVFGGESTTLEGEVPSRLDYDLNGSGLACDIEKQGSGNLRVVLTVGENQVVRETNAKDATISLDYRGGNVIASTSSSQSSSSSSSVVQQSSSVRSQSSNSSNQQSSSSINQSVSVTN